MQCPVLDISTWHPDSTPRQTPCPAAWGHRPVICSFCLRLGCRELPGQSHPSPPRTQPGGADVWATSVQQGTPVVDSDHPELPASRSCMASPHLPVLDLLPAPSRGEADPWLTPRTLTPTCQHQLRERPAVHGYRPRLQLHPRLSCPAFPSAPICSPIF